MSPMKRCKWCNLENPLYVEYHIKNVLCIGTYRHISLKKGAVKKQPPKKDCNLTPEGIGKQSFLWYN